MFLSYSTVTIIGTMSLTNNSAISGHGGGIALTESYLVIKGEVHFTGNRAGLGGAIFVYDATFLVYCSSEVYGLECVIEDCFFQPAPASNGSLMVFNGNLAKVGSVLHGGWLY